MCRRVVTRKVGVLRRRDSAGASHETSRKGGAKGHRQLLSTPYAPPAVPNLQREPTWYDYPHTCEVCGKNSAYPSRVSTDGLDYIRIEVRCHACDATWRERRESRFPLEPRNRR